MSRKFPGRGTGKGGGKACEGVKGGDDDAFWILETRRLAEDDGFLNELMGNKTGRDYFVGRAVGVVGR